MANNFKISDPPANAAVDAITALLNGGFLDIYDGSQPATPATAISTQTKLAGLTLANPAFASSSGGVAAANTIGADTDADATGTASWFRAFKSDHTTAICDGSVGTSGCDLNLNSVAIQIHARVQVDSWSLTLPES